MAQFIGQEPGKTPQITIAPSQVWEVTHYVASVGKARALLDYNPQMPLREGIRQAAAWSLDWWGRERP
jgi:nucleoside-diphosphate-sugar epimerase